jgi:uncharacterized membrane protein YoaK (UPF0700 family)
VRATLKSISDFQNLKSHPESHLQGLKLWAVLAFQAGWINGGGFLACKRFVTHTTGFATQFGFDLAMTRWKDALAMLSVPVFFMCGAMIGAFYIDRPIQNQQRPQLHSVFFLIFLFLTTATALGTMGAFGEFGNEIQSWHNYILIVLLCLSSGIQNASSTTLSKNYVRTTHMTGYTTDLGISIMRLLSFEDNERRDYETKHNRIRLTVLIAFILGTGVSSVLFLHFGYIGFIVPALISAVLFMIAKKEYTAS